MRTRLATSDADFDAVRRLFREYDASLDVDLSVQGIEAEIAAIPGKYAAPAGALLVAETDDQIIVGVVAVRPFGNAGAAELKRLYVAQRGRGTGQGRALVSAAIAFARSAGYSELLLDTLPSMKAGLKLYHDLGFRECPPYWNSTLPGVRYFGLALT